MRIYETGNAGETCNLGTGGCWELGGVRMWVPRWVVG